RNLDNRCRCPQYDWKLSQAARSNATMRNGLKGFISAVAAAGVGALIAASTLPLAGQTAAYRAPRTPDGKPDLNGIWQAVNEANYDIEMHMARPAMQLRPGPAPIDSWMGQSVAHWEGETLVIDANGFNEESWLDRSGNFHSDALHVVERYTRTAPDIISYEATLEDPKVFTRPWKIGMPLY